MPPGDVNNVVKKKHRGGIVATVRSHSRIVTVGRAQRPAALPPVHINVFRGASEMPMTSKITCRCGRVSLTACGDRFIYLVGGLEWCCGDCVRLPRRVASTTSRVVKPPSAATRARQRVRSAARRPPRRAPRPPSGPPARLADPPPARRRSAAPFRRRRRPRSSALASNPTTT